MNKQDLVDMVCKEMKEPKAKAEKYVNTILDCVKKGLKKDKVVQLIGFGSFNVRMRKARTGRNPRTGEPIKIKASKTVAFRPGKAWKETL